MKISNIKVGYFNCGHGFHVEKSKKFISMIIKKLILYLKLILLVSKNVV